MRQRTPTPRQWMLAATSALLTAVGSVAIGTAIATAFGIA